MTRTAAVLSGCLVVSCATLSDRPRTTGTPVAAARADPPTWGPIERSTPLSPRARPGPVPSMAVWDDRLVVIDSTLQLSAWRLADLTFDAALTRSLATGRLQAVGSAEGILWAYGEGWVRCWDAAREAWVARYEAPATPEPLLRFVVWQEGIALVRRHQVFLPVSQRSIPVPELHGPRFIASGLEGREALGQGQRLWLGESLGGELGGVLAGLDLSTGTWVQYGENGFAGATGLTGDGRRLLVGSSSDFDRGSFLGDFGLDGRPLGELRPLDYVELERIALGPDGRLWAVDRHDYAAGPSEEPVVHHHQLVVVPGRGSPTVVADLKASGAFEKDAQGTVGVVAMKVVGEETVVLLPWRGPPVVVRGGAVHRLERAN